MEQSGLPIDLFVWIQVSARSRCRGALTFLCIVQWPAASMPRIRERPERGENRPHVNQWQTLYIFSQFVSCVHLMRSVMNLIYEVPLTLTTSNMSLAGRTVCMGLIFLHEHCDEWELLQLMHVISAPCGLLILDWAHKCVCSFFFCSVSLSDFFSSLFYTVEEEGQV